MNGVGLQRQSKKYRAAYLGVCILVACSGICQDNSRIGGFGINPSGFISPQADVNFAPTDPVENSKILGEHPFQKINGQIINLTLHGFIAAGDIESSAQGVAILHFHGFYKRFALTNFNGQTVHGDYIRVCAMTNGIYMDGDTPLQLMDCGTPLSPSEEQNEFQKIEAKRLALEKQRLDAENFNKFIIQSNAVVTLIQHATNGESWAQCSLGNHYLNGIGCETNLDAAKYWFQKAAEQGDLEASNNLAKLKR